MDITKLNKQLIFDCLDKLTVVNKCYCCIEIFKSVSKMSISYNKKLLRTFNKDEKILIKTEVNGKLNTYAFFTYDGLVKYLTTTKIISQDLVFEYFKISYKNDALLLIIKKLSTENKDIFKVSIINWLFDKRKRLKKFNNKTVTSIELLDYLNSNPKGILTDRKEKLIKFINES